MSIYKGNRVAGTYPLYGTTGESIAGPYDPKGCYRSAQLN